MLRKYVTDGEIHYNIFDFRQRILGNGWETVARSGQRQRFSTCCKVSLLLLPALVKPLPM
jgi:hypothetical protein